MVTSKMQMDVICKQIEVLGDCPSRAKMSSALEKVRVLIPTKQSFGN